MDNHRYGISLCIKGEEDRILGNKVSGIPSVGDSVLWQWQHHGSISLFEDIPKASALTIIERVLAAKMPESMHGFDQWSLLKMQACLNRFYFDTGVNYGWKVESHIHPVYIGLYWQGEDYHERQWELNLYSSQLFEK